VRETAQNGNLQKVVLEMLENNTHEVGKKKKRKGKIAKIPYLSKGGWMGPASFTWKGGKKGLNFQELTRVNPK